MWIYKMLWLLSYVLPNFSDIVVYLLVKTVVNRIF